MKKIIIILILAFVVLIYAVPWNILMLIPTGDDSIFAISHETWVLIVKSDITNDYNELADWFMKYHGEAPDQQVMSDIAEWSVMNEFGFKKLLAIIKNRSAEKKLALMGFVIHQSGQYEDFISKYQNDSSPEIKLIIQKATEDKNNVEAYYINQKKE